jgi:hypothetical protein
MCLEAGLEQFGQIAADPKVSTNDGSTVWASSMLLHLVTGPAGRMQFAAVRMQATAMVSSDLEI